MTSSSMDMDGSPEHSSFVKIAYKVQCSKQTFARQKGRNKINKTTSFIPAGERECNLPWQEGPVFQTFTYSSLLFIFVFYLIVALVVSKKEKDE